MKQQEIRNNLDDAFYLNQATPSEPKETFKFVADIARNLPGDVKSWHDIGCGTGELANYLRHLFPGLQVSGSDISSDLIDMAKSRYPDIPFSIGNFTELRSNSIAQGHDIVSLIGVHGRFRHLDAWLPSFTSHIKHQGYGLIFDLFNPEPVDVIVSASESGAIANDYENTYFNLVSMASVKSKLDHLGFKSTFHRFEMPFAIEKQDDPFRSWTIDLASGERRLINGLGQIFDFYLCVINK